MKIATGAREYVESLTGSAIASCDSVGGGSISQALSVRLKNGTTIFLKYCSDSPGGLFEAEAAGLTALRNNTTLVVPEVLGTFSKPDGAGIVLEYLQVNVSGGPPSEDLARGLVELHQSKGPSFGFVSNNFIGSTRQINTPDLSWGQFFVQQRLSYQVALGREQGWLPGRTRELFERGSARLREILNEPDEPAVLLHGDLWSGNVLATDRGAALIDPAVYYGNREADIAFTEFFGGFGQEFYRNYQKLLPLKSGYPLRKEIYNLYHLLNHANMFGGHYVQHAILKITDLVECS